MKTIFAIIFSVFSLTVSAQAVTNVYWTTDTELKAKDVIYYNPKVALDWNDFAGPPKPIGQTVALTASGFGYKVSASSSSSGGEISIGVYCYFSKPDSWVKKGNDNELVLNHEQRHFDITYIITKIFIDRLKAEKITFQNINTLIPKIYKECNAALTEMQDSYDNVTKHGIDRTTQAWWDAKILSLLK